MSEHHSDYEIREIVLDLCSEDDFGSWELWWKVSEGVPEKDIVLRKELFLDTVENLIGDGKLISKIHAVDGKCRTAMFNKEKLSNEIESASAPEPNSFYWFGVGDVASAEAA